MSIQLVTRTDQAQASVIERAEWLLEEAKTGRITGIVVGWVTNDGGVSAGYSRCENGGALMGAAALALHRVTVGD